MANANEMLTSSEREMLKLLDAADMGSSIPTYTFDECVSVLKFARQRLVDDEKQVRLYTQWLNKEVDNVRRDQRTLTIARHLVMQHLETPQPNGGADVAEPAEAEAHRALRRAMNLGVKEKA